MQNLQRAILVNVIPPEIDKAEALSQFDELVRLIETYGGIVILKILQRRGRPSAKTFVGEGKAEEIARLVRELKADVVVINGFLKANQSNHLINIIPCEVLDRFEMILKIFEKHARTPEAKLQLKIAQHKYEFPKLFGKGAALSQQATGIAARTAVSTGAGRRASRGPGEKILEVKRRYFREQIQTLEKQLEQFRRVREFQRERRRRENFLTIALVGYTNSGKSSLLRALTKKENIVVENKLFSTLDTRLGHLHQASKILIADTIGFMRNLPPLLFSSFLATLEEVKEADVLLNVIDLSDPVMFEKIKVVEDILVQLECDKKPCIYVFNKIDIAHNADKEYLAHVFSKFSPVFVSALTKENLNEL
ncbi:GTPase HflX, partial [Candidatus Peregrinibacteria bacterium]|nr:GTPase HflX [Candidatus Peregrinibacteria bacterium]